MSLKECYEKMGADYEDVLSRLRSEGLVRKFAVKFLDDDSYAALKDAMAAGNALGAMAGQLFSAAGSADPVEALGKLKKLLDAGLIEQSEYDEKKKGGCTGDRGLKAV